MRKLDKMINLYLLNILSPSLLLIVFLSQTAMLVIRSLLKVATNSQHKIKTTINMVVATAPNSSRAVGGTECVIRQVLMGSISTEVIRTQNILQLE